MGRILVIDDEASIRTMLEQAITSAGYDVLLAANGKEGMRQHRASAADVAIIDLFMPDHDGMETIATFRREFPNVAIIAISGNDPSGAMLSVARQLGAARVLEKPFDASTIVEMIEDVLRAGPR